MDIFCLGATLAELLLDEPIQKRHHAQHFGSPDYLHYLAEPVDLKVGIYLAVAGGPRNSTV